MCEVFVDNEPCYPGKAVAGRIECFFNTQKNVESVQILFEGNGRVKFGTKNPIVQEEKYCNLQIEVPKNADNITQCPAGRCTYSFSFNLPYKIPGSLTLDHGYVCYWITAIVYPAGESPVKFRKKVVVGSSVDLNAYAVCKNPVIKSEYKERIYMIFKQPKITFDVELPQTGYVPSQNITFTAKVDNMSSINISGVRFKLVQIFKTIAQDFILEHPKDLGEELDAPDGEIAPETDKSWKMQLQIPSNTLAPDLSGCNIIRMHCELIGRVVLPFPHRDLILKVPFRLGNVPIKNTLL